MTSKSMLIATSSWEDRYGLGMRASLDDAQFDEVVILSSDRFAKETKPTTDALGLLCRENKIQLHSEQFDFESPVEVLGKIDRLFDEVIMRGVETVIFDISTTPRSIAWTVLDALTRYQVDITVRYYAGNEYGDWQTNEEGEPRLMLKRSGIMYPDQPTSLILLCGPEISRAEKMCFHFEPKSVLVLRDPRAADYGSVKHLPSEYRSITQEIEFDNKDLSANNYNRLDTFADGLLNGNEPRNVVAAALGPKLGALLLYRLSHKRIEVGLGYVISGRHNFLATTGLGNRSDISLDLT